MGFPLAQTRQCAYSRPSRTSARGRSNGDAYDGRRGPARARLPQAADRDRQRDQLGRAASRTSWSTSRTRCSTSWTPSASRSSPSTPRTRSCSRCSRPGQEVKEIRVPKTFGSIAGFTALSPQDRQHQERLRPGRARRGSTRTCKFDSRWDKASGFRTEPGAGHARSCSRSTCSACCSSSTSAAAAPSRPRTRRRPRSSPRSWASPSTTSTARRAPTSPRSTARLVDKGLVSEKDIEKAVSERPRQPDRRGQGPDRGLQGRQGGDRHAPSPSSTTAPFWEPAGRTIPEDLKARAHRRVPEEEHVRARREEGGHAPRRRRGPLRPHAPRRHQGHEPGPAPRLRGGPARATSWSYINASYGVAAARAAARSRTSAASSWSSARGEEDEVEGERGDARSPRSTRRTAASSSSPTRSSSTRYNEGASDIHVEPYGKTAPTVVRLRIDGDCAEVPRDPARRTATRSCSASRSWRSSTSPRSASPRTARSASRARWARSSCASPPSRPRAATRTWSCASWPRSKPLPLEKMGFSERNLAEFKTILAEALRHLPGGGPHRLGQDHDAALRPRLHQHRGHEDLDRRGPGRDHAGRACARCRCTPRSTSPSRSPCARSCAPTPT